MFLRGKRLGSLVTCLTKSADCTKNKKGLYRNCGNLGFQSDFCCRRQKPHRIQDTGSTIKKKFKKNDFSLSTEKVEVTQFVHDRRKC